MAGWSSGEGALPLEERSGSLSAYSSSSRRVTRGETTASPRATVRMAPTSSAGGTSLSRKPLAPARSALKAYSSRSNVVRMSTRVSIPAADDDGPRRLDAVEHRHAHVHQDDVGRVELDEPRRRRPVGGLAHDLDAGLGLEDHAEALAQQRLVVGQDDADTHARTGALQSRSVAAPSSRPRPRPGAQRAAEGRRPLGHPGHAVARRLPVGGAGAVGRVRPPSRARR